MTTELPDFRLLQACDGAAWTQAWRCLWPMALRAAKHPETCLAAWEAEDVASEAILELIAQIDSVASGDEIKALVITIAFRRAVDVSRRKSTQKRRAPDDAEEQEGGAGPSIAELSELELRELTLLLRRALEVLDGQTRELLLEKIGRELTYQEISTRRGIPIGTVCTKVARGLRLLRAKLQERPLLLKELREYLR